MNFLDRQIIYILFPSIKAEMAFSDLQLALLGGTSFAIFYTLLGIPFGRLADKGSRTKLIAFGLAIWSLFSALTGFADSFWTIFACRVMVGVGEATLGPAAISLLADYFPPTKRATVTSIYSMGIAIGAGLAAIFRRLFKSDRLARSVLYRRVSGFDLCRFCFLSARTRTHDSNRFGRKFFLLPIGKNLFRTKRSLCFVWVYAFLGLATNNLSIWGATYLNRLYEIPIPTIGYWLGILTLAAGVPATLFGGAIADWFRRKRRRGGRMYFRRDPFDCFARFMAFDSVFE